ncbi:maltodextrin glucosidase [Corallincola luteus]|uniref:Maltodextrin glucosidase n=1 Tax=Corallincola luteus TaxID=1775177 RepID=A0ABY2APK0_9GAMM|nr:maltodextrin glucosidase [Corallincola luteus]TCI04508.1 maltodextrin glucosidase [Corallincola luteus]
MSSFTASPIVDLSSAAASGQRLLHWQIAPYLVPSDHSYLVTLLLHSSLNAKQVFLRAEPDNEEYLLPMTLTSAGAGDWLSYQAELPLNPAEPTTVYCFKVVTEDNQLWLDAAGESPHMPMREQSFKIVVGIAPPAWVPQQVFYQVFVERFNNGDPTCDMAKGAYQVRHQGPVKAKPWGEPIDGDNPNTEFYGGDLVGVKNKLDYLQSLGVTALYLNPVFTSPSVHKYDIEDYENVDLNFGGNQALAALTDDMHQRGMKILLDAVFNHCSDTHPWFNRWGTQDSIGAHQGKHSPYYDYFTFMDPNNPDSEFCWQGSKVIPVLNLGHPELKAYFFDAPDAITRRWMQPPYNVDGWRVDVIHMMGEGPHADNNAKVLGQMRQAIKETNPEGYFLGEHFFENTRWTQGELEDGAMNYYGFALPLRAFLAKQDVNYHPHQLSAEQFDAWLRQTRSRTPYATQLCQLNLLDTHDTARFFTLLNEDEGLMKLAVVLLMTYPGVPCIYYGDETGMVGGNDPYNRACFDWDEAHWIHSLWQHYQQMIALRQQTPALQTGAYHTLYAEGDGFAFARFDAEQCCVIAINRSADRPLTMALTADFMAALNLVGQWSLLAGEGINKDGVITLPATGFAVWSRS